MNPAHLLDPKGFAKQNSKMRPPRNGTSPFFHFWQVEVDFLVTFISCEN